MSRKIKFHAFHILFRLFAYLADKSGGWQVFVHPKLLLGSLIVGLGLNATSIAQNQNSNQQRKKESPKDKTDSIRSKAIEEKVYCYVTEQMPQYPGGESALLNFIYKNLKYPESAIKDKIQGKVVVRFVVTESGEIDKIGVIRSLQPDCDKEAIRVIKLLPKFIPGKQSGKLTKVWFTLPVTFKLEKNDGQKN
jgi:periplasmic protein TonB